MKRKIRKFVVALDCIDVADCIDAAMLERTSLFDEEIHLKRSKNRSRGYLSKKKRSTKQRHVHANKQAGIISMETFLKNYLGVDGEALNQLKNISHDDLLKIGFEEVKRVPFELVDGYGSQFFYVMDSNGMKIGYYNPNEQLKIQKVNDLNSQLSTNEVDEYVSYINRNTKGTEKFNGEDYYDMLEYYSQDDLEADLNEIYNNIEIGEEKYGKCKRK